MRPAAWAAGQNQRLLRRVSGKPVHLDTPEAEAYAEQRIQCLRDSVGVDLLERVRIEKMQVTPAKALC